MLPKFHGWNEVGNTYPAEIVIQASPDEALFFFWLAADCYFHNGVDFDEARWERVIRMWLPIHDPFCHPDEVIDRWKKHGARLEVLPFKIYADADNGGKG